MTSSDMAEPSTAKPVDVLAELEACNLATFKAAAAGVREIMSSDKNQDPSIRFASLESKRNEQLETFIKQKSCNHFLESVVQDETASNGIMCAFNETLASDKSKTQIAQLLNDREADLAKQSRYVDEMVQNRKLLHEQIASEITNLVSSHEEMSKRKKFLDDMKNDSEYRSQLKEWYKLLLYLENILTLVDLLENGSQTEWEEARNNLGDYQSMDLPEFDEETLLEAINHVETNFPYLMSAEFFTELQKQSSTVREFFNGLESNLQKLRQECLKSRSIPSYSKDAATYLKPEDRTLIGAQVKRDLNHLAVGGRLNGVKVLGLKRASNIISAIFAIKSPSPTTSTFLDDDDTLFDSIEGCEQIINTSAEGYLLYEIDASIPENEGKRESLLTQFTQNFPSSHSNPAGFIPAQLVDAAYEKFIMSYTDVLVNDEVQAMVWENARTLFTLDEFIAHSQLPALSENSAFQLFRRSNFQTPNDFIAEYSACE